MSRRRKPSVRSVRQARTTVLAVGEGDSDAAFLRHMKRLYAPRYSGVTVTIGNARGKGPQHVIDYAIGQAGLLAGGYDVAGAMIDNDLGCSPAYMKKAKRRGLILIWSTPCLEGLLLAILDQHVPQQSSHCKARFDRLYGIDRCDAKAYEPLFPLELLQEQRRHLPNLKALCELMEGKR